MSRGYTVSLPTVTNAVGGDPSTGTKWNKSWVDQEADAINDVMTDIDADVTYLYSEIGSDTPDNVTYKYKDSATVTVSSGQAGAFTISSETDVDFTGATVSTRYYLWVGEDSVSGVTAVKKGTSLSSAPAGLVSATAHRLRWYVDIDGSGNVTPFWFPFGDDIDDVTYEPDSGDPTKLTVLAGGKFTDHEGTLWRIEEDISLDIDSDWTSDGTLAVGFAYLWAGEDSSGDLKIVISEEGDELPSELVKGRRLRGGISIYDDSGTKKIIPFIFDGVFYFYNVAIVGGGSDQTEVFDGTMSTTFLDVDCSAFAPASAWVRVVIRADNTQPSWRVDGESTAGQWVARIYPTANYEAKLTDGIYEAKNNPSKTTRISVAGFWPRQGGRA